MGRQECAGACATLLAKVEKSRGGETHLVPNVRERQARESKDELERERERGREGGREGARLETFVTLMEVSLCRKES